MKKICELISSNSCSSSSSSSSCIIESPIITKKDETKQPLITPKTKPKKRVRAKKVVNASPHDSATSPKSRSSIFRGVTRHRCTKRYEAHLWDKTTWNSSQNKRGRQIYLGAFDNEEDAARTYDLAALKYWGPTTVLNFPVDTYTKEFEGMQNLTKEEFLVSLRRRSSGFSRGVSKYRGVARHHHNGRWEARIGRVSGNKYLYLGTYDTQEEAAAAYDMAAIEFRGPNAVTNFDMSNYAEKIKNIPSEMQLLEDDDTQEIKQELVSSSYDKILQADEMHEHEQVINQVQPSNSMFELTIDSINNDSQSMIMMGPTEEHLQYPWDLCLDTSFDSPSIPDVSIGKEHELLGLFDDIRFEEDIEFIFDVPQFIDGHEIFPNTGESCKGEVDEVLIGRETSVTTSHSSSSLSTMTSVSSDI